jgi:hypothetical protein
MLHSNGSYGLSISVAYRENVISLNVSGTILSGVNAGGKVCNGTLTCP